MSKQAQTSVFFFLIYHLLMSSLHVLLCAHSFDNKGLLGWHPSAQGLNPGYATFPMLVGSPSHYMSSPC